VDVLELDMQLIEFGGGAFFRSRHTRFSGSTDRMITQSR
jgi:hypothetical protein